ncbi:hypothetical protein J1N35_028255 [Gossypium stocksii]|uniref:SAM-dependent MTase DRM-type domain-containing protein n=1 Tax=Gossypium stocksii TaxID=47602 RepID=A0A9D3UVV9_9ROSI|nr:hypothetical protein J1N35_028255 [Gossypium stocksii]
MSLEIVRRLPLPHLERGNFTSSLHRCLFTPPLPLEIRIDFNIVGGFIFGFLIRNILRSWWEQTNQRGTLTDIQDVQELNGDRLEQLIKNFGGFDLVVGGSPCNNLTGSNRYHRDGLEAVAAAATKTMSQISCFSSINRIFQLYHRPTFRPVSRSKQHHEKLKEKKAEYEAVASTDSSVNHEDVDNKIITKVLGPERYGQVRFQGSGVTPT